jgi:hypothetical protein
MAKVDPFEVSLWEVEPVSSILQKVHFEYVKKNLKSLSVVSEHRSEGKTTLAMLVARGLKEVYDMNVLLVDLNPQGDALLSKYLGNYSSVEGMVTKHPFPFSIFRIKDMNIDWTKTSFDGPFFNAQVAAFSGKYDVVIVDSFNPGNPQDSILRVNTDSNLIVQSESKKSTDKLQKELAHDRKHLIGIVLNK